MCKISISAASPVKTTKVVNIIKKITDLSIRSIVDRLSLGKKGVFYTTELFLNDHCERAAEIRSIVNAFSASDIELYIVEIGYDEIWEEGVDYESRRITPDELIAILDENSNNFS